MIILYGTYVGQLTRWPCSQAPPVGDETGMAGERHEGKITFYKDCSSYNIGQLCKS